MIRSTSYTAGANCVVMDRTPDRSPPFAPGEAYYYAACQACPWVGPERATVGWAVRDGKRHDDADSGAFA